MKKLMFTTAAAVAILAVPFAGKADAAQIQPVQTKVVYYTFDTANLSDKYDWCTPIFKNYNVDLKWDKKQYKKYDYKAQAAKPEGKTAKPKQQVEQTPAPKPAPTPAPAPKPAPAPTPAPAPKPAPAPAPAPKPAPAQPVTEAQSQLSAFEQQVFDLTNQERTKNGLAPLKVDLDLSKVAREKSRDMSVNKYFDHNSPTYGSPFDMMKKFGITYRSAGENIAMGQRTPQEVVTAWMNSSGHRANILGKDFTHIGVGYVENGNYWTQQFIGK